LRKFSLDADHKRELLADLEDKLGAKTREYSVLSKDLLTASKKRDEAIQLSEQSAHLSAEVADSKKRLVELHESERALQDRLHKRMLRSIPIYSPEGAMQGTRLKFEKDEKDRQENLQVEAMRKFQRSSAKCTVTSWIKNLRSRSNCPWRLKSS